MIKPNDASKLKIEDVEVFTLDLGGAATCTVRELRDDELQNASGGHKFYDLLISSYQSG